MKRKKLVMSFLAIFSALNIYTINAKASMMHSSRSTYPKSMRGTWYYYDGYSHRMVTEHISAHKDYTSGDKKGNEYTSIIKKFKNHNMDNRGRYFIKTLNWYFVEGTPKINGYNWLAIRGWNKDVGGMNYLNVHKFNGHEVLTTGYGPGPIVDIKSGGHHYRSKRLAMSLHDKKYPNFEYSHY